jgi:hypothetical protein
VGRRTGLALALATMAVAVLASLPAAAGAATRHGTGTLCVARHVNYVEGKIDVHYRPGCTGHDEPELDPVSSLPHSARDLTWTFVLPTDGKFPVAGTGFGFWFGGTVTDPNPKALFNQGFLEVQFYPDTLVSKCFQNGNSTFTFAKNTYTVCSPVWSIVGNNEPAAFNAMLRRAGGHGKPLVMHAGDTITLHYHGTPANDGAHIDVADLTTGRHGSIVLRNKRTGAMNPAFDVQKIGNALGWGIVDDAPNSFVWEIGHRSDFSHRPGAFCAPGHSGCESYNWRAWRDTTPIRILGVKFGDGSAAKHWAVVSDFGGKAEILDPKETGSTCTHYGGPYCIYPWFTQNTDGSLTYGVDYPTTADDFGKANQFERRLRCGGPFGTDSTYCMTLIR